MWGTVLSVGLDFFLRECHMNQRSTTSMEGDYVLDMFLFLQQKFIGSSASTAHPQVFLTTYSCITPLTHNQNCSDSLGYVFVCFLGPKITDPSVLKKQARELVRNWPSELLNIIDLTPDDTIIRTPLVDRWLWPAISPPASSGGVVLVGDAWHPMTPNLGQGACCALEDAVVLAKKLSDALRLGPESVEGALRLYGSERWPRIFPLTIRANLVGSLLQWDNPVVCSVRNNVIVPKLVRLGPLLEHTNFEFEPL